MTLEELADTLPNGFHDSYVDGLHLDFVNRTAVLELAVWVGDLNSKVEIDRERRRKARLVLRGLQFFVIDAPDPKYKYAEAKPLWVDLCEPPDGSPLPRPTPRDAFTSSFFVNQWNAFAHVAATDASIVWIE